MVAQVLGFETFQIFVGIGADAAPFLMDEVSICFEQERTAETELSDFNLCSLCFLLSNPYFFKYLIVVVPMVPLKANGVWSK